MGSVVDWWERNIVEPGKLPLLLALLAFVVTFVVTRCITRMIRAGKGPFHDLSAGGRHLHHVVPGVILMCVGGFGGVAAPGRGWIAAGTAIVFGIGVGLVMDEFALILYLHDVYWSEQGQKSVEAVVLTAALCTILLFGFLPLGVAGAGPETWLDRGSLIVTLVINFLLALVALMKGKVRTTVFGILVPLVALVGAVRLARPGSFWDRHVYRFRPRAAARARRREEKHVRRWGRLEQKVDDLVAGTPAPPPGDGKEGAGKAKDDQGGDGS
ncbi:hypothetical protein [Streptomyces avicenniae]|uniref:hypothetical protein n=1 Tax=Streptomyces avicenniae TaxID=500153 RepID=UPI00069BE35E|nr:hypothetical protein [Streptomyces avicenniae]